MAKRNLFSGSRLPPGFRFHPTDVEVIMYYLKRKVLGKKILPPHAISDVDIYKYAPWDLQHKSCWRGGDLKWYFFCPAEKKYANGGRMKRSTDLGYWKTTGKDRAVQYNKEVVGMIKTLVFHRGKAPKGTRTDWVMYEYRLEDKKLADEGVAQDSYVLCMLFEKEGPGPKNGAQYGAPFREEDWENDDEEEEEEVMVEEMNRGQVFASVNCYAPVSGAPCGQSASEVVEEMNGGGVVSSAGFSFPGFGPPNNPSSSVKKDGASSAGFFGLVSGLPDYPVSSVVTNVPDYVCPTSSVSCPSQTLPSVDVCVPEVSNADKALSEAQVTSHDEVGALLAIFSDEFDGNMNFENIDELNNDGLAEASQSTEGVGIHNGLRTSEANPVAYGVDIFSDLGDLSNQYGFSERANNLSSYYGNNGDFLELRDFAVPMDCYADGLWN